MQLTYAFCDDWLIYARAADGSWWSTITETWPQWLDAARDAGIDPDDDAAVDELATAPRAVETHMVPRVTAWDSDLSPTASVVSAPSAAGLQGATRHARARRRRVRRVDAGARQPGRRPRSVRGPPPMSAHHHQPPVLPRRQRT